VNFCLSHVVLERSAVSASGTFKALAASFTGMPDRQGDILVPGLFRDSLAEINSRGGHIPLLWQHDAAEPIGAISNARETVRGLEVDGALALDAVANAKRAYSLMRVGGLSLSVGFLCTPGGAELRADGARLLRKADLFEVSTVPIPADAGAIIHTVKGFELDYERAARVYFGLPKRKAELLIQKGLAAMGGSDSELDAAKADAAAARIERLLSKF
jgi:HK97 family phage prohead protease